jgi:5-methyltetrahydropteroyltriglutamate--homocysteine methyltransferase
MNSIRTQNLGYPRIGEKRELKRVVESFWKGQCTEESLLAQAKELRERNWKKQQSAGIDLIPSNDFSLYDQVLDQCVLTGTIPTRFEGEDQSIETYFKMARGGRSKNGQPQPAMEMTKWFDTNYHYLVPEFTPKTKFRLNSTKPFDEFQEALAIGIKTKPVLLGPITFLLLGKTREQSGFDPLTLTQSLLEVYIATLKRLAQLGAEWVQLDEPILSTDLTEDQKIQFHTAYKHLTQEVPEIKLLVANYFGDLRDNLELLVSLPVAAIHIDAVRGANEVERVAQKLQKNALLSIGVIDGRNIWKNDYTQSLQTLRKTAIHLDKERIIVAPSCSLLHSPVTLTQESKLDSELKNWLAFADQKLVEIVELAQLLSSEGHPDLLKANKDAIESRENSPRIHNPTVTKRLAENTSSDRASAFSERKVKQQQRLQLPLLPTTTIGSFPQTDEVRTARAQFKKGKLTVEEYDQFLEKEVAQCVRIQEEIGLDVLVHGEFERNDMVEYFGEQLSGFAFTEHGWVQSYGSRCVKPPIIYGDVSRSAPMTIRWSRYAQSLTQRPMKGMLTGPVTILQWSFVRNDQPRFDTAKQIALALRDEVVDLEQNGIGIIQIDEPALREGLPLRRADWKQYLDWAIEAFRLSAAGVKDETQIHTHMCYSEFNDIIASVAALDADVISIETSRSAMELLDAFADFRYPQDIGPGVWDIHSPRVPSAEEMATLLEKAHSVLAVEQIWVNPDCGLKTRRWEEVKPALENLVTAAKTLRTQKQDPIGSK